MDVDLPQNFPHFFYGIHTLFHLCHDGGVVNICNSVSLAGFFLFCSRKATKKKID